MIFDAWYWRWRLRGIEPEMCLGCGGALEVQTFAACSAGAGRVSVVAYGLPFRACASGCADRRFAAPQFAARVLGAVLERSAMPVARTGEHGGLRCCRCVSRQWTPATSHTDVRGGIHLPNVPAFVLVVNGPARACASCGLVQLVPTPEVREDLGRALEQTWRAAGLRSRFRPPRRGQPAASGLRAQATSSGR